MPSYTSSGSASSSRSSSTFHLACSPQHSDAELQRLQAKAQPSPSGDTALHNCRNTSCETDNFVIMPDQFPRALCWLLGVLGFQAGHYPPLHPSAPLILLAGLHSSVGVTTASLCPFLSQHRSTTNSTWSRKYTLLACMAQSGPACAVLIVVVGVPQGVGRLELPLLSNQAQGGQRSAIAGCQLKGPYQPSPQVGTIPEQTGPFSIHTGQQSPQATPSHEFPQPTSFEDLSTMPTHIQTVSDLSHISRATGKRKGPFKRSLRTGRLSDMLLKAAFGVNLLDGGSNAERPMDTTGS